VDLQYSVRKALKHQGQAPWQLVTDKLSALPSAPERLISLPNRALQFALKRTQSKLTALNEIWTDIPNFHRIVIFLSISALALMSVLYLVKIVTDLSAVATTAVFALIVLFLDLGIPLRDELLHRKNT